jgi:hypothetical protein
MYLIIFRVIRLSVFQNIVCLLIPVCVYWTGFVQITVTPFRVCPIMCKVYVIVEFLYDLCVRPGMAARAYKYVSKIGERELNSHTPRV